MRWAGCGEGGEVCAGEGGTEGVMVMGMGAAIIVALRTTLTGTHPLPQVSIGAATGSASEERGSVGV